MHLHQISFYPLFKYQTTNTQNTNRRQKQKKTKKVNKRTNNKKRKVLQITTNKCHIDI